MFRGINSKNIPKQYLLKPYKLKDFSLVNLLVVYKIIGIDCLAFIFYYTNLGLLNIIIEERLDSEKIRIINFEITGYFP
jgi:hypothetical protein